jgi:hypothetical protein
MTKPIVLLLVSLFSLTFSTLTFATPLTPEELFSDDAIESFRLSPDGKYIAYVMPKATPVWSPLLRWPP